MTAIKSSSSGRQGSAARQADQAPAARSRARSTTKPRRRKAS